MRGRQRGSLREHTKVHAAQQLTVCIILASRGYLLTPAATPPQPAFVAWPPCPADQVHVGQPSNPPDRSPTPCLPPLPSHPHALRGLVADDQALVVCGAWPNHDHRLALALGLGREGRGGRREGRSTGQLIRVSGPEGGAGADQTFNKTNRTPSNVWRVCTLDMAVQRHAVRSPPGNTAPGRSLPGGATPWGGPAGEEAWLAAQAAVSTPPTAVAAAVAHLE